MLDRLSASRVIDVLSFSQECLVHPAMIDCTIEVGSEEQEKIVSLVAARFTSKPSSPAAERSA